MSEARHEAIVITGATGHVGGALVRRLQAKAPLALLGNDLGRVGAGLSPAAQVALIAGVDVLDESSVEAGIAQARAKLGAIRALVHTVGAYAGSTQVGQQPLDGVRKLFEVNFLSAVNLVKAVLPDVLAGADGRILLFASADALRGRAGAAAYAASKAALLRFAEALAEEVAPRGVGVRVFIPTTIDTPSNRAAMPEADVAAWVSLEEVANAVEFALSPASAGLRFAAIQLGR